MDSINSAAVVLSNILTIIVVLASLWFARAGYMAEQKKVLSKFDEVKEMINCWEQWRKEHEGESSAYLRQLNKTWEDAVRHTAQIAELDRRLVRWEDRELKKTEQK